MDVVVAVHRQQPPVPLELKQIDPLIRDLITYRDVVARLTSTTQETT